MRIGPTHFSSWVHPFYKLGPPFFNFGPTRFGAWVYPILSIYRGSQFYDFEVAEFAVVDGEAYEGAYLVKAMYARGTGVDVEDVEARVVHHFEDVRVAADEEGGGIRT